MGLRSRLAHWLNGPAPTPQGSPASVAEPSLASLAARIDALELQKPAFLLELEAIYDRCHEILEATESKRGRVAAQESRLKKKLEGGGEDQVPADERGRPIAFVPSWRRNGGAM